MSNQEKLVFISHSSKDRKIANTICMLLEKKDIPCWIAPRDVTPGKSYGEEIINAIEETQVNILILSEHSNKSLHVKNEVERGVSKGKSIIPIRIQEVNPSKALELFVSTAHWVDAWKPPLEQKIDQVASAIHSLIGNQAKPILSKNSGAKLAKSPLHLFFIISITFTILLTSFFFYNYFWKGKNKKISSVDDTLIDVNLKVSKSENNNLKGVNIEIEAALKLAYNAKVDESAPAAAMAVLKQNAFSESESWYPLSNGETVSSADNYRIIFQSEKAAYFYIFQIDSRGNLDLLFPFNKNAPYSVGINPVSPEKWIQLPGENEAFHLDENLGIEHIYVVVTNNRWNAFEEVLSKATRSNSLGLPVNKNFGLQIRGIGGKRFIKTDLPANLMISSNDVKQLLIGKSGVLVKEFWFKHVNPNK